MAINDKLYNSKLESIADRVSSAERKSQSYDSDHPTLNDLITGRVDPISYIVTKVDNFMKG